MKTMYIDFSGFIEANPSEIEFVCIGSDKPDITGIEYMKLSEEERIDYILADFSDAIKSALDVTYGELEIVITDE